MSTAVAAPRPLRLPLESITAAIVAATVAATLAWLGPPGTDLAAHAYQRTVFLHHGFQLWNNFWYAGRYSFVTYSLLYYPLAAAFGIKLLAVISIAIAALAFAIVVEDQWGAAARWSSRAFAVVWAGIVLSAAFPFALGVAFALLAMRAAQIGRRRSFAVLVLLTLAASPLAFLLLALLLLPFAGWRGRGLRERWLLVVVVIAVGVLEVALWRAFPAAGRYPFHLNQLFAAVVFCGLGVALTWRVQRARPLCGVFAVYLAACVGTYLFPWEVGANIERLRYFALPIAVLAVSLRSWRPAPICLAAVALALYWNVDPFVTNFERAEADPLASQQYWTPTIRYLSKHMDPSYRVEAVDTTGHWAAARLPAAGIPLARGWFRQDDFPENEALYARPTAAAYREWLRTLGVRYVVLSNAMPDYSARTEAALLRSGRSGLRPVFRSGYITVFAVPSPRSIVTGPGDARVVDLRSSHLTLALSQVGEYRLAIRFSPYWHSTTACLYAGKDGMIRVVAHRAGVTKLFFHVGLVRALETVLGSKSVCQQ